MALRLEDKKQLVKEVNAVAGDSVTAVAAEYRGLSVAEMTELRKEARNAGVYMRVVKNTLARFAAEKAGKPGAVYRRKDGIVIIDHKEAKGMRWLTNACPYGAVFWNEEADLPQKCTFCAHLLDQGF